MTEKKPPKTISDSPIRYGEFPDWYIPLIKNSIKSGILPPLPRGAHSQRSDETYHRHAVACINGRWLQWDRWGMIPDDGGILITQPFCDVPEPGYMDGEFRDIIEDMIQFSIYLGLPGGGIGIGDGIRIEYRFSPKSYFESMELHRRYRTAERIRHVKTSRYLPVFSQIHID